MKSFGRRVLLVTLFAVVVYAGMALTSDLRQLRRDLLDYSWTSFGVALALAFGNYVARFGKWEFYLRRLRIGANAPGEAFRPIPMFESFVIYLSGFVMSITPGKAGEVFKSALLFSARGIPVTRSAPIIVADRLSDLISLIVLVAIGSTAFPGFGWIAALAAALVAGVLVFVVFEKLAMRFIDVIARIGPLGRIAPKLREAYAALREVSTPGALILMSLVSLVGWGFECAALSVIMRGLGTPVDMKLATFAYATATVAGAIAMLPGGLGGTEITMRKILTSVGGAAAPIASAATLLVRLATLWFAVLVGFVALAVFRRRYDRGAGIRATEGEVATSIAAG